MADAEELQENDASDVYLRIMNTKHVLVPIRRNNVTVPFVNGSAKLAGKGSEIRHIRPNSARYRRKEENTAAIFKEKRMNQILQRNNENKTNWKQSMISGVYPEASFFVIMFKKDKNCMCHRTARFSSHSIIH